VNTNFISVLMFQLEIEEESNTIDEYIVENENYAYQMNTSYGHIMDLNPDIVVYPEMCYINANYGKLRELSKNRLIIAGSLYECGINYTIVFYDGNMSKIIKRYSSGAEPMSRKTRYIDPNAFVKDYLNEHIFEIKGQKICVLNCMEYYHMAYFIARNSELSINLFAIISPSSTNNMSVFEQETMAIHNHNEYIYSFVANCISTYNGKEYATGESYIYGPIHKHEKEWLKQDGIISENHPSSIARMYKNQSYIYGEFATTTRLSRFGRSDFYETNPRNVIIGNLTNK